MVLRDNNFIEGFLIAAEKQNLSAADEAEYRRPFLNPGVDRRAMLSWARQISLDGSPADVTRIVSDLSEWLRTSPVPKLWVKGDPGFVPNGRLATFFQSLKNQTEVQVKSVHFLQESSRSEIGKVVANFVRSLRDQ